MSTSRLEVAEVMLGTHKGARPDLFGPLPARRSGNVLAFEMAAPTAFETWPGRGRVERKYALLDLGVSFGIPCWSTHTRSDGTVYSMPPEQQDCWYVDLVTVDRDSADRYVLRDLFVDIMICDGRLPRMLDLDEFADARLAGWITTGQLLDGLRRWQRFLDRHVHTSRFPQVGWSDFPPAAIQPLSDLSEMFGSPVTWPEDVDR